jgi:hypothetical protein
MGRDKLRNFLLGRDLEKLYDNDFAPFRESLILTLVCPTAGVPYQVCRRWCPL